MEQKEITPDTIAQELTKIEEATLEEELERKRLGLPQEPGGQIVQTESTKEVFAPKEKDKIANFIKNWTEKNGDYKISNLTPATVFSNSTELPITRELADYWTGQIKSHVERNEKFKGYAVIFEGLKIVYAYTDSRWPLILFFKNDKYPSNPIIANIDESGERGYTFYVN